MTNKFKSKFLKLLKEAPELDFDPTMERDAAESSMDGIDDVGIDDYDVDMEPDPNAINNTDDPMARQNEQMSNLLDKWITNINKFTKYINGEQSTSIQKTLQAANPNSNLANLKKHQDKIAKIAADLAGLAELFSPSKNTK